MDQNESAPASRGQNQQEGFVFPLIYSNFDSLCVDALACSVERLCLTTGTVTATAVSPFTNHFYGFTDPIPVNAQFSGCTQNLSSLEDVKALLVSLTTPRGEQEQLQHLGEPQVIEMILWQVKDYLCDLMMDQHCTPLIEKIFEASSVHDITRILSLVVLDEEKLRQVCMHNYGTLVMRKLLDYLTTPEQIWTAIFAMKSITVGLSKNFNGGYIILHCFRLFSPVLTTFITDEVAKNCIEIVANNVGCCVLQKYLHLATRDATWPLIEGIASYALILTTHPFGNYVVQSVVKMKIPYVTAMIISQLRGKCAQLSMNKYASNVVECLIEFSERRDAAIITREIMLHPNLVAITQDISGNYVVRRALRHCQGTLYKMFSAIILYHYSNLYNHFYGKRVIGFVQRRNERAKNRRQRKA